MAEVSNSAQLPLPALPADLHDDHLPERITGRLDEARKHNYFGDAVLGAVDGCVTTFAVVAGAQGGDLSAGVALLLGGANVLADGFSMAVSNYQKAVSDREVVDKVRRMELAHIEQIPDGEREEVRQIFARKGFQEPTLGHIVDVITADRQLWVDTMIVEEHGMQLDTPNPWKAAGATYAAFVVMGMVPLGPFVLAQALGWSAREVFTFSTAATGLAFGAIGLLKGYILHRPLVRSGLETFIAGGVAALLAYIAGVALRQWVGAF